MDLGFDTVGNGTLIAYDSGPVLVTDPWLGGNLYFGSWQMSHEIPEEQSQAVDAAPFVWVSHGHPDHLHGPSLERLRGKTILLPDHRGSRIAEALDEEGHRPRVLVDRSWTRLSDRIRVWTFSDSMQDAGLLVELDGSTLIVNLNDLSNTGWMPAVRKVARDYPTVLVMAASGFGDIRWMNFWDTDGNAIPSYAQLRVEAGVKIGPENAALTDAVCGTHFVPFSSMHQYQREDTLWANKYVTGLDDYTNGYDSNTSVPLPPYIRYEVGGDMTELLPKEILAPPMPPSSFGDDWSETLTPAEAKEVTDYFERIETLGSHLDFVTVRVGGREHGVKYQAGDIGVSFEVPRGSLLTTVRYRIWDDLFASQFMRTTWHGLSVDEGLAAFLAVGRYADQADVVTASQLEEYMSHYRDRAGRLATVRHRVEQELVGHGQGEGAVRSALYRLGRSVYRETIKR